MIRSLFLLASIIFSFPVLADTFACQIKVGDQTDTIYEEMRTRKVRVFAGTWACDGNVIGARIEVKMYEPHLQVDGDIYTKSGPLYKSVKLDLGNASCHCSLM